MRRLEFDGMDIVFRAVGILLMAGITLSVFVHWLTGASETTSAIAQIGLGAGGALSLLGIYMGGAYLYTVFRYWSE